MSKLFCTIVQTTMTLGLHKTEILVTGSKAQRPKLSRKLNPLNPLLSLSQQARNLGIIFDSEFNFKAHIESVTKSAFCHLKNKTEVWPRPSLSDTDRRL